MKIIIAGGRDYETPPGNKHSKQIRLLLDDNKCNEIVSGGCTGADNFGEWMAENLYIKIKRFKANWEKYGKAAGPMRNEKMAQYVGSSGGCILLPGGKGTANMKKNAEKYGLKIWEIK